MSRKTVVVLRVEVELTLPPGATVPAALQYVRDSIASYKGGMNLNNPLASLNPDLIRTKLIERKTTYL